jgi:hypothetical protein
MEIKVECSLHMQQLDIYVYAYQLSLLQSCSIDMGKIPLSKAVGPVVGTMSLMSRFHR